MSFAKLIIPGPEAKGFGAVWNPKMALSTRTMTLVDLSLLGHSVKNATKAKGEVEMTDEWGRLDEKGLLNLKVFSPQARGSGVGQIKRKSAI